MREVPPLRWSDVRYKIMKNSIPKKYTYLSKQVSPNFVYIHNLLHVLSLLMVHILSNP